MVLVKWQISVIETWYYTIHSHLHRGTRYRKDGINFVDAVDEVLETEPGGKDVRNEFFRGSAQAVDLLPTLDNMPDSYRLEHLLQSRHDSANSSTRRRSICILCLHDWCLQSIARLLQ